MEFIETRTFTHMVTSLLSDDEYRELQNELLDDPERGDILSDKETAVLRNYVKEL